jgi:cytochrome c oxidase cbb3-type subunit 3
MNNQPHEAKLLDHEVDGIKELDNLLPRWWVWLFHLTIAFSVVYLLYYHVFDVGALQAAEYEREAKRGEQIKSAAIARFESGLDKLQPSTDPAVKTEGQRIYSISCAPCHRLDGGGLVGPNLCDDYWIHGSNYVDNLKTIINGVPAKGMITWRGLLTPDQIQAVGSYIYTLRGTHPPNPKPREDQAPAATGPSEYE